MRWLLVLLVLAAGVAGGWVLWERTEDDGHTVGWNTCSNPAAGYSVEYPPGWHTDHLALGDACKYFSPHPFELEAAEDWPPSPLQVVMFEGSRFADDPFEEAVSAATDAQRVKVLEREALELDGNRALRVHSEVVSGTEHSPAGTRSYYYVIDGDGVVMLVGTTSTAGVDYSAWRRVVDRAAMSIRFAKSVVVRVEGGNVPPTQLGLPAAVAAKRARIWRAAQAHDYDGLAALVDRDGFEYTFGGAVPGGPAAYWRQIEREEEPLEQLSAILQLPYVYDPQSKLYIWPFAFTRKASTLSRKEKEELADAIGEESVRSYEQLDSYLGWRAGIDADGEWVFYVAGD